MRRSLFALFFTSALLSVTACQQEKKDLLALPAAYNPKDAELTFNKKNLDAFNTMNEAARKQHIKTLKETPGSFSGQAVFEAGNGLSKTVEESQHGEYELFAHVTDPVLYEITIDYNQVEHTTTFDDGRVHATFTQTGTFVADALEPGSLDASGTFTVWGNFNANGGAVNGTFTFNLRGKYSDGTSVGIHVTDHFNTTPTGGDFAFTHCRER